MSNDLVTILTIYCRLQTHNMTTKDAYEYFVLKAQDIALSKKWTPVNWYDQYIYDNLNKETDLCPYFVLDVPFECHL